MKQQEWNSASHIVTLDQYHELHAVITEALNSKLMRHPTVTMIMNAIDEPKKVLTWRLIWIIAHLDISMQYMPHRQFFVRSALNELIPEMESRITDD